MRINFKAPGTARNYHDRPCAVLSRARPCRMESYTCPVNARTEPQSGPAALAVDPARSLALARDVLATEAAAIAALSARLGDPFVAAVEMIINCRGRIVVS